MTKGVPSGATLAASNRRTVGQVSKGQERPFASPPWAKPRRGSKGGGRTWLRSSGNHDWSGLRSWTGRNAFHPSGIERRRSNGAEEAQCLGDATARGMQRGCAATPLPRLRVLPRTSCASPKLPISRSHRSLIKGVQFSGAGLHLWCHRFPE